MKCTRYLIQNIQKGFTVVDLMIVMATIAILLGLVSVNLIGVQDKANLNTTLNTLVSDIRTQQLKAMVGDTQGTSTPGQFGLHFDADSYTLFYGPVYEPSESSNIVVELPDTLEFQPIGFPLSQVVFDIGSGEVVGFVSGQNTVTLLNTSSNEQEVIGLNRYGAVIEGP